MKITKYGHCCLLIEEQELRILTDPGNLSTLQSQAQDVGLILITHEHNDHLHLESLKEVLENNPDALIITNSGVGKILDTEGIQYETLEDGQSREEKGVLIEAFGNDHAIIYPELIPQVQNTGYFIADRFYYPGDAFHNPGKQVEILALPVSAPWCKISEVLDFAKEIGPEKAFPVHDGFLSTGGAFHLLPEKLLEQGFIEMNTGDTKEF